MTGRRQTLTLAEQEEIEQRKQTGLCLREIAAELGCSF